MKMMTYPRRVRGLIAMAALGALASGFSTIGAAAGATTIVRYGDLDASTAPGATALYGRIGAAAKHACSSFDRPLDLDAEALKRDCISQVIAKAVIEVNSPALFTVYKANNGTPLPRAWHTS